MKNKKIVLLTVFALLALPFTSLMDDDFMVKAAAITNMSISGTGITSNSSAVSTAITPTFTFTLGTAIVSTDQLSISFTPAAGAAETIQ